MSTLEDKVRIVNKYLSIGNTIKFGAHEYAIIEDLLCVKITDEHFLVADTPYNSFTKFCGNLTEEELVPLVFSNAMSKSKRYDTRFKS